MRFDPSRVLDLADRMDEDSPDDRTIDLVADALSEVGWTITGLPVASGATWWFIGLATLPPLACLALWWLGPTLGRIREDVGVDPMGLVAGVSMGLVLLGLGFGPRLHAHLRGWTTPSHHLLATRSVSSSTPWASRLILLATEPEMGRGAWRWRLSLALAAGLALVGGWSLKWLSEPTRTYVLIGSVAVAGLAVFLYLRLRRVEAIRPASTGPALLPELARCLPRSVVDRVDVWLVLTSCKRDIARQLRERLRDGPPTDLIDLDAPGCGLLIVAGTGVAAEHAADSATSLQIPFRRRWRGGPHLGSFAGRGIPCVTLAGRPDQPPDPALLRAVEHLIAEFALRRVRSARTA